MNFYSSKEFHYFQRAFCHYKFNRYFQLIYFKVSEDDIFLLLFEIIQRVSNAMKVLFFNSNFKC